MQSRLYIFNDFAVCKSAVHLFYRPSVYADKRCATLLCGKGTLYRVDAAFVYSCAYLHGGGNAYGARYGSCNAFDKLGVFHQRRALAVAEDLVDGTAHIYVNGNRGHRFHCVRQNMRRLCHDLGLRAEYLHRNGPLVG